MVEVEDLGGLEVGEDGEEFLNGVWVGGEVEGFGDEPRGVFGEGFALEGDFGIFFFEGDFGGGEGGLVEDLGCAEEAETIDKEVADEDGAEVGVGEVGADVELVFHGTFGGADEESGEAGGGLAGFGLEEGVEAAPGGVATDAELAERAAFGVEHCDFDAVVIEADLAEVIDFLTVDDVFDLESSGELDEGGYDAGVGEILPWFFQEPCGVGFGEGAAGAVVVEDFDASDVLGIELVEDLAFFEGRGAEEEVEVAAGLLEDGEGGETEGEEGEEDGGEEAHL